MGLAKGDSGGDTQNKVIHHTEKIVETPVYKEVIIERPVYKDVIVERAVFVNKQVEVTNVSVKEEVKVIQVPQVQFHSVDVEVPKYHTRDVYDTVLKQKLVEYEVKVPKIIYVDELVKVQKVVIEEVKKYIEVPVVVDKTVYIDRPVYQDRIIIREKTRFKCEKCGHQHEEMREKKE